MKTFNQRVRSVSLGFLRRCGIALCLCIFLITGVESGLTASTSELNYFKLVQMPGIQDNEPMFILLDSEIFKYCEPDFSDVRIFDAGKNEVPRIIHRKSDSNTEFPLFDYSVTEDSDLRQTVIDVTTNGEPLNGLKFSSAARNFRRSVSVEEKNETGYRTIGKGDIFDSQDAESGDSLWVVPVEETRQREFRILIANGEEQPLAIDDVQGVGPQYQAIFKARAGASYQLFWGSSEIGAPDWNTADLDELVANDAVMKRARTGRGFANPELTEDASGQVDSKSDHSWIFRIVALIIGLAVLVLLLKSGKRQQ